MMTWISRARLVGMTSLMLLPASAYAVFIASPGFPTIDPALAADHYFERTQYSINNSIYPGDSNGNNGSQTFPADKDTVISQPILAVQAAGDLGAAFGNEQTIASGTVFGSSGAGVLKVYAQAYAHAGIARSDVSMTIDIIDKMTVHNGGKPDFAVDISGAPTRQFQDSNNFANSWGSADVYVWSASQGVPLPGQFFQPAFHTHFQINWDGTTSSTDTDPTAVFADGTTWYYAARVQANAVANISDGPFWLSPVYPDFQATADFSHSFDLHIDADPSTPNFSYTMASGINYVTAAAPEPATALMLLVSSAALFRRRRS